MAAALKLDLNTVTYRRVCFYLEMEIVSVMIMNDEYCPNCNNTLLINYIKLMVCHDSVSATWYWTSKPTSLVHLSL